MIMVKDNEVYGIIDWFTHFAVLVAMGSISVEPSMVLRANELAQNLEKAKRGYPGDVQG